MTIKVIKCWFCHREPTRESIDHALRAIQPIECAYGDRGCAASTSWHFQNLINIDNDMLSRPKNRIDFLGEVSGCRPVGLRASGLIAVIDMLCVVYK